MAKGIIAKRRLWLTADRARLVEDGDPAAAFLFSVAGEEIPAAEAARVGLAEFEAELDARSLEGTVGSEAEPGGAVDPASTPEPTEPEPGDELEAKGPPGDATDKGVAPTRRGKRARTKG